ncbi:MAG: nitroreductase family protein [Anaerolineaceae bacterium]|nr:nitroreductase family protein [Anaerolineaceae bacterium]
MKEIEEYPELSYVFNRRSIRKFKQQPVPNNMIEVLLKAAMAAPSAMNNQPWEFVVIDDPKILGKVRQQMIFGRQETPLAIAVCGNKRKARNKFSATDFWIQDCSAATQNILLCASSLGLGSVWLGVHPVKIFSAGISRILKLPRHIKPLCIIYLGYPDQEKAAHTKYTEKNVHWQSFGNQGSEEVTS